MRPRRGECVHCHWWTACCPRQWIFSSGFETDCYLIDKFQYIMRHKPETLFWKVTLRTHLKRVIERSCLRGFRHATARDVC